MKTKKIYPLSAYTALDNGLWVERSSIQIICWQKNDEILIYKPKQKLKNLQIPVLRAFIYLYHQLIGKHIFMWKIRDELSAQTKTNLQIPIIPSSGGFPLVKILLTITISYYLLNLQLFLGGLFYDNLPVLAALPLAVLTEYVFIFIIILICIRIFIPVTKLHSFCRFNQAMMLQSTTYVRHHTPFLIVCLLSSIYLSILVINIFSLPFFLVLIFAYVITYELYTFCESYLTNYFFFIIYSPVYLLNKYFTLPPTKKEQKCATFALK